MKRYLLAVTVASSLALAFAVGCGSSSGGTGGSAGSAGSSGTKGSGGSAGSGGGSGCATVTGTGDEETCAYEDDSLGNTCTAPQVSGSCPSSGLAGCCVVTTQVSGYTLTSAACIYDSAAVSDEMTACNKAANSKWSTSAP